MILEDDQKKKIESRIEMILGELGLDLVEIKLFPQGASLVVRVIADFPYGGITLRDCEKANRRIFSYLEEEKVLGDDFIVEVISPGVDRKLKAKKDFLRVLDRELKIWLYNPLKGKNYWEGKLIEVRDEGIVIQSKEILSIPYEIINFARQKYEDE